MTRRKNKATGALSKTEEKALNTQPPRKRAAKKVPSEDAPAGEVESVRKQVEANFSSYVADVSPLELAHLVIAMGLTSEKSGPAKAMGLLNQCARFIGRSRRMFANIGKGFAQGAAERTELLMRFGFDPKNPPEWITGAQILKVLKFEKLRVGGRDLRGRKLFEEFLRQTTSADSKSLGKSGEHEDVFTASAVVQLDKRYHQWRSKIAKKNQASGKKNLPRSRKGSTPEVGADAEYPVSLERRDPFTRGPKG